jgi:protein-disulfide isomerase
VNADQDVARLTRSLRRTRILTVVLAVVAAVLGLALIAVQTGGAATRAGGSATGDASGRPSLSSLADRTDGDPLSIGPADAPVVMIEWSDYRCPFCAAFAKDAFPELREEYFDTGKVRFEFRDLAIFGDQSVDAAVAARAAGEQGKYFAFATALFDAAPAKGHPDMPKDKLIGFARTAGVPDLARFERDLGDDALRARVQADTARAQELGANGTPFFVIGDTPLSGAQPTEVFRQVIEDELDKAGVR